MTGCNVENASYGLTLCAECGLVSALHARRAAPGPLVAVSVVAGDGAPLVPCGRCRQLLLEAGGPALLLDTDAAPRGSAACCRRRVHRRRPGRPAGPTMPDAVDLIRAKRTAAADRRRHPLADRRLHRRRIADEQMSALLMAIFFRGLSRAELRPGPTR